MNTLRIITSQEYRMNQPHVFTKVNGKYVGDLVYPNVRNYPELSYWETATSSDFDRGFSIIEKEFTDEEIAKIETLQSVVNNLSSLIPSQPKFNYPSKNYKVKRGAAYENYKAETEKVEKAITAYFDNIRIYDNARSKAQKELMAILKK
jgi:ABC-type sulfate transport system substrate-binding protein